MPRKTFATEKKSRVCQSLHRTSNELRVSPFSTSSCQVIKVRGLLRFSFSSRFTQLSLSFSLSRAYFSFRPRSKELAMWKYKKKVTQLMNKTRYRVKWPRYYVVDCLRNCHIVQKKNDTRKIPFTARPLFASSSFQGPSSIHVSR